MLKTSTKISIIIPTYNYGSYISQTLSRIIEQTHENVEIIVVDDGSTDNTRSIVESIGDRRIRYIHQLNRGACAARNRGIEEANGDYLLFHDADDLIEPRHLEKYLMVAIENPGSNVYGSSAKIKLEDAEIKVLSTKGRCPGNDLLEYWLGHWAIPVHCILWPRVNVEKVGKWDEMLHANQDGDFAMRALVAGIPFIFSEDAPPAMYLRHENEAEQISSTINEKTALSKIKVLEKIEQLLIDNCKWHSKYRNIIGYKYYEFARLWLHVLPEISDSCFDKYIKLNGLRKPPGSYANWLMILLFGLRRKEQIAMRIGKYVPWRI
ncbi:MAG: glycosyltransferase family A protein [Candidatus Vecturithrix sp.]|jgi:glycosyltransferase involved in cell wall biosynthesis|nr:glycosyltransferase family A protein [Candidatus Vecturithrix sp.]